MPRPSLLDVNVLIALFDSAHVHHSAAHAWFSVAGSRGWRTCPLTENGFLRILSHPAYPNPAMIITDLADRLEEFKATSPGYAFLPDDFSASEWLRASRPAISSAKLTDAYLLKLAVSHGSALASFDLRIVPALVGESDPETVDHIPVTS